MTQEERSLPDVTLERYRLGELDAGSAGQVEELLRTSAQLRARLEELNASDEDIRRRHPPAWLAERIGARLDARRRVSGGLLRVWPVPATLALLLLVWPRHAVPPAAVVAPDAVRVKGLEPSLKLYRKTPSGSEELADGAVAAAGDLIRLGYLSPPGTYGVILSVDGAGQVTRHLPRTGARARPLEASGTVLLDFAYELDDAPRWERFYLVTAERAFDVAGVVAAVGALGPEARASAPATLRLPGGLEQFVISLRKQARKVAP